MTQSILCTIKNLSLSYGSKLLFNQAELSIFEGDHIGLLGLNGQGKSSLFKVLTGEVGPNITTPPFEFRKKKVDDSSSVGFSVFLVPQEMPEGAKNLKSTKDIFFYFYPHLKIDYDRMFQGDISPELHDESERRFTQNFGYERLSRFDSYLKVFDIEENINFDNLSGGEQKKILLALGLSSFESLVLWDEPTNHLDQETIMLLEDELQVSTNAFILISHDRTLLSKLTQKIFQIRRGKIESFSGSYTDYLEYLKASELSLQRTLAKLKNSLEREQQWMRQGVKARGTRSKKRVSNFHDLKSKVSDLKSTMKRNLELTLESSNRQTKILAELRAVGLSFGQKILFQNLNGLIQKGDKIGLIGKNGVGKSSLVKLLAKTLLPTSGSLKMTEDLIIQYFSQKRDFYQNDHDTPYDILTHGSDTITLPNGSAIHVVSYFENFLFHRDDLKRPMKTFSGGEKSRLQLAYELTKPGDLLIFDEPTNDLDLETIQILEDKLIDFDGSIILISHDRAFLSNVTNKVWLLKDQTLEVFTGGFEQVSPYLETLMLESQLNESEAEDMKVSSVKIDPPPPKELLPKPSHRNEIRELILKNEKLLAIFEEKIAHFDYSKLNDPKNGEFKILNDAKNEIEERLMKLYEEES